MHWVRGVRERPWTWGCWGWGWSLGWDWECGPLFCDDDGVGVGVDAVCRVRSMLLSVGELLLASGVVMVSFFGFRSP